MLEALTDKLAAFFGRCRGGEDLARRTSGGDAGVRTALLEADVHFKVVRTSPIRWWRRRSGARHREPEAGEVNDQDRVDELVNLMGPVDTADLLREAGRRSYDGGLQGRVRRRRAGSWRSTW